MFSVTTMNEIKRILFIDDECETFREGLSVSFGKDIEIVYCPSKDSALKEIDSKKHFDLIILDWFLEEPDNSNLSQLVLQHLYNRFFIPVFIWSHHIEDFNKESGSISYPKMLIISISKSEITAELIKGKIEEWLGKSLTAQISMVYRNCIRDNLEKTFFELADISDVDISTILKILVGSEENIDWSNDFILNLIHRRLLADNSFIEKLRALITSIATDSGSADLTKRRKILNKALYYHSSPGTLRCGDIVKIQKDGDILKYGVIVSPDCDIEKKNSRYIEIVELRNIDDEELKLTTGQKDNISRYNNDSFYYFPAVCVDGNLYNDFVAILKSKIIVEGIHLVNTGKYPSVPEKLTYSDSYLHNSKEVKLVHICSKSNPYKSDFLHKLHAHNSRVGTPDIKDILRH